MYQAGHKPKTKRRRVVAWVLFFVLLLVVVTSGFVYIRSKLQPHTTIKQAAATTTKVEYSNNAVKHYDEPDFTIDMPSAWQPLPQPAGPYKRYDWQNSRNSTNGEVITVYQDTIPVNFAVNRVLIVEGQEGQLSQKGGASDNCSTFTKNVSTQPNQVGAPAKWQGVDFLCDQLNQERDTIGTSSTDGVNTVILKNPSTGVPHKFFFTYTTHSISPDYSVFYAALNSLKLK
jgi:hypothetical protein